MFTDLVFVGRFQPLHNEHVRVLEAALAMAEHVIVVIGSANTHRTAKNPFTAEERARMVAGAVSDPSRVSFIYSNDYPYDWHRWEYEIQDLVHDVVLNDLNGGPGKPRLHGLCERYIGLVCPRKDKETSEYLDLFQRWEHVEIDVMEPMNATDVRAAMFDTGGYRSMVPVATQLVIDNVVPNGELVRVRDEYQYIKSYKEMWKTAPFPPMFITVDNVVIHRQNILLIKRGGQPGNGLWALPGGFHEVGQTLWNSALRELHEETTLKGVEDYFVGTHAFDNPSRSQLGAMVTHGFLFVIPDEVDVPLVEGQDDAAHAEWFPLANLEPQIMHDDHFWIVEHFFQEGWL